MTVLAFRGRLGHVHRKPDFLELCVFCKRGSGQVLWLVRKLTQVGRLGAAWVLRKLGRLGPLRGAAVRAKLRELAILRGLRGGGVPPGPSELSELSAPAEAAVMPEGAELSTFPQLSSVTEFQFVRLPVLASSPRRSWLSAAPGAGAAPHARHAT